MKNTRPTETDVSDDGGPIRANYTKRLRLFWNHLFGKEEECIHYFDGLCTILLLDNLEFHKRDFASSHCTMCENFERCKVPEKKGD